jgi:hypothetical protein
MAFAARANSCPSFNEFFPNCFLNDREYDGFNPLKRGETSPKRKRAGKLPALFIQG